MAHFLLSTMWTRGDVLPFQRLGASLVRRGHDVTLVTHRVFEEEARAAGFAFEAIDEATDYEGLVEDNGLFNSPQGFVTIYRRHVLTRLAREVAALRRAAQK